MFDRLQYIASKHGISANALKELELLYEAIAPRIPTQRINGAGDIDRTSSPVENEDFRSRYQILRIIGIGGFSEVHEAWDRHVQRRVALKIQNPLRHSPEDDARFREEIRIVARLEHPGIVPIYDWGTLPDGRLGFAMKLVQGETIRAQISRLHALEGPEFIQALRRLVDNFRRLCEPVASAHARGIIHRDLTPQNLMVGKFGEAHVMDWGLARDMGRDVQSAEEDAPNEERRVRDPSENCVRTHVAGTPFYMPPEQARGEIAAMGPPGDVYTLGAVLYEILSGYPPYRSRARDVESLPRFLDVVVNEPPQRIEDVARREAPPGLYAVCIKAMARSPVERYSHAGVLMEALRDWLDGADRQARARRIVDDAHRQHRSTMERLREQAVQQRAQARKILEKLRTFDRAQEKAEGWKLEDEAAELEQQVLREEIHWTQKLRSALNEAPDLEEAHLPLAEHYAERLLRADAVHDEPAAMSYVALLEEHAGRLRPEDRIRYQALLQGDGYLTLHTIPERVTVIIQPYELVNRYLMPNDKKALTLTTPICRLQLPRGSYLLTLTAPGYRAAAYPVNVTRAEHWDAIRPGQTTSHPVYLIGENDLEEDDIYIPAGWSIVGGDSRAGESLSLKRVWVDAFVMRKYPVTNAEYVQFLNALIAEGRADEAHRHCPRRFPGGASSENEQFAYSYDDFNGRYVLRMPDVESKLPVVCVDWYSATAYAAYLARHTGVCWRLPSEFEWEKAARGVDGRFMPWGNHLEPTWACVSGSHAELKQAMSVNSYPTDVSPYGVRGMAGNVRDWCIEPWSLDGSRVENDILQIDRADVRDDMIIAVRGGAWISAGDLMRIGIRYAERPTRRHGVLGFRLARSIQF